jgi:DNA adenine methylase
MKTPITYYGGKQTMLKHILPLIPSHSLYTEAFCGGCAVLFAKQPSDCEVINDLNRGLINFYWIASVNYPDLKT